MQAVRHAGLGAALTLFGGACDREPTPPAAVARVEITAPDTAGLVGTTLQLTATGYDRTGGVVAGARFLWRVLDGSRASVDSLGRVVLGPGAGDVLVVALEVHALHADTVSVHGAVEGEVKWVLALGDSTSNVDGPALSPDGTITVLTLPFPSSQELADLRAVSARGVEQWRLRLDRTGYNAHLVGPDGTIYVTGRTVRAVTPLGAVQWARPFLDAFGAEFTTGALASSSVLVIAPGPRPVALQAVTGDTVWAGPVSATGGWLVPPTIAGPTVWIKKTADSLYAFALSSGAIGRQIEDPDTSVDKRSFGVGPVPLGTKVYVPTAYRLAAFDTAGMLDWLTANRGRGVTEPVVDPDGNVYVQTNADGLLALDPATGAWRWRRLAARPRWTWYGGPALAAGGVIYCAALDGFYAYDTAGNLRWSHQTMEGGSQLVPFIGAPAIAPDGTVYTYTDTRLYAFWAGRPPEPNSPWAMWRHDAQRTGRAW